MSELSTDNQFDTYRWFGHRTANSGPRSADYSSDVRGPGAASFSPARQSWARARTLSAPISETMTTTRLSSQPGSRQIMCQRSGVPSPACATIVTCHLDPHHSEGSWPDSDDGASDAAERRGDRERSCRGQAGGGGHGDRSFRSGDDDALMCWFVGKSEDTNFVAQKLRMVNRTMTGSNSGCNNTLMLPNHFSPFQACGSCAD